MVCKINPGRISVFSHLQSFWDHLRVARRLPDLKILGGNLSTLNFWPKIISSHQVMHIKATKTLWFAKITQLKSVFFLILWSFWGRQRDPKAINTDMSWFFLTNHRCLVALICIIRWNLMVLGQKIKVERSPPRFIALGAFWRPLNDPKMTQNEKKH